MFPNISLPFNPLTIVGHVNVGYALKIYNIQGKVGKNALNTV